MSGEALAAALLLGFAGSAHCVAMCGGVATALGRTRGNGDDGGSQAIRAQLLLGAGRLTTYAGIGALAGALGLALAEALGPVFGPRTAQTARIGLGLLLVALGLALAGWLPLGPVERMGLPVWRRMRPALARLGSDSRLPGPVRTLALGGIWGLLPCGLVYAAAAVATATGSALEGALFMACFGIGTLPAVVGVGTLGSRLWTSMGRHGLRRAPGLAVVACGVWTLVAPIAMSALNAGSHHH